MRFGINIFFLCSALLFLLVGNALAEVTADPIGMGISVSEEPIELAIVLTNNSDQDAAFTARAQWIIPRDNRGGPHRDEFGDIVREFNLPYRENAGMAWDGELLWGTCRTGTRRLFAMDPEQDFRVVRDFALQQSDAIGLMWEPVEGLLWVNEHVAPNNPSIAWRYNRDGEFVDRLNQPRGGHWDWCTDGTFVYGHSEHSQNQQRIYKMNRNAEVITEGPDLRALINHGRAISVEYVRDHPEGNFWVMAVGFIAQVNIDWDNGEAEVIREFRSQNADYPHQGLTHNGENLIAGGNWAGQLGYVYDDGIEELRVLTLNPTTGVVSANDDALIEVSATPEGAEDGVYNHLVTIRITEEDRLYEIPMSIVVSVNSPTANVNVNVIDLSDDEPIPWAWMELDAYQISRYSNRAGDLSIQSLPLGSYIMTFTAPDYLPLVMEIELNEAGDYDFTAEMLHSLCNLSVQNVMRTLPPDASEDVNFSISNDGNGPLTFRAERELLGDANAAPWEYRRGYPISEIVEDDRVQGVVFANDRFYVAGSAARQKKMYVVSREGELLNTYDQFSTSTYGHNDLAWDGELIWGTGERRVYGFTPEGELVIDWDGPFATNNNLAWDSDRESLWVSGNTTNIVLSDREGNRGRELNRKGLRIYGLSYWPEDPDGYNLYIFHNPTGEVQAVTKMHPVSGDTLPVVITEPEGGGRPAASFITNEFDVYSWVFITISNPGATDRIDVWQLDARKDWMTIVPTEGVIAAGESQDFVLTLDATGLPTVRFEGQIVFYHDGVSGRTILPITLDVAEGRVEVVRRYDFAAGWNMISFNVEPEISNVVELFSPLVEQDLLVMLKDGSGRFYRPEFGFNNIPRWVVSEGYQIRLTEACFLDVRGITMLADEPIQLSRGWQIISYFPRQQVDAITAFTNIADNLEIAKDVAGRFYLPAWGFSNMQPLREGQGYQLKMTDPDELVINFQQVAGYTHQPLSDPMYQVSPSGSNMSVLVLSEDLSGEIHVFAGDRLVGSGVLSNGVAGIAVWGDDPSTEEIDGASEGELLRFVNYGGESEGSIIPQFAVGSAIYETDGIAVIKSISKINTPQTYHLSGIYPNPFNSTARLSYGIPEAGLVKLQVYDTSGRKVTDLVNSVQNAGNYSLTWNASSLPSGVYLIKMQTETFNTTLKVILMR